jgi:hypothetical protein
MGVFSAGKSSGLLTAIAVRGAVNHNRQARQKENITIPHPGKPSLFIVSGHKFLKNFTLVNLILRESLS